MSYPFRGQPPWLFPSLPVILHDNDGNALSDTLSTLVDTGADATLVPAHYLTESNADLLQIARIRSHWGEARTVKLYLINLLVAGEHLAGIEVVADDRGDEVILGRNVRNKLLLLIDGPRHQTDVFTRRPQRL